MNEEKLWAFVFRADTREKIAIAKQWLKDHFDEIGADLFDDLMIYLSHTQRAICFEEQGLEY